MKPEERDAKLTAGWRSSADRAVTSDGDATGLHLLVATAAGGYSWRTAATLSEPGTSTDQWIGQYCVTGSGKRAVVVYAPRAAVNKENMFHAGALAAVVDLDTGAVTKLDQPVSIAYHNPGCGAGELAVLSRLDSDNSSQSTRLMIVDTAKATIGTTVTVPGQVTSAVPYAGNIAAVRGNSLVKVDAAGKQTVLQETAGAPSRLVPTASGALGYEVARQDQIEVHDLADGHDTVLGTGAVGDLQLHSASAMAVITGPKASTLAPADRLPGGWRAINAPANAEVSTTGELVLTSSTNRSEAAASTGSTPVDGRPQPVSIAATVPAKGVSLDFLVAPEPLRPAEGSAPTPARPPAPSGGQMSALAATDPANTTIDPDRTCAIPRNDPRILSLQPSPRMSEWAVDLAIQGKLGIQRPPGWNGSTLGGYSPQNLFPPHPLAGGGRIPAQIMLGVLSQESNMWQASPHAVDGESGNFHQGGFYGNLGDNTYVDFPHADCGYGMAQVTDGMRVGDTKYSYLQQMALTIDYTANIAAGMQILQDKWNQLYSLGVTVNGGDPQYLENWWYALWAYNSGWHAQGTDPTGMYGLGWTNNMANPDYPADRKVFLSATRDDAKTPNHWSYPERVIGWAAYSLVRYDYNQKKYLPSFPTAFWPNGVQRAEPLKFTFCDPAKNQCDSTKPHVPAGYPGSGPTACQRDDLKCWWHDSNTWIACPGMCGVESLTFTGSEPEPTVATPYPSRCGTGPGVDDSGLPGNALVIDDVPADVGSGCATKGFTNSGTLDFNFASRIQNGTQTTYPSKIDFHQIGAGFGGHFWFAHAWNNVAAYAQNRVTGTWTLNQPLNGWARLLVHVTDHGAETQQANYTIRVGQANYVTRTIPQGAEQNKWISLGAFNFSGTPTVALDNYTNQNMTTAQQGVQDVVWDAVAFAPLPGKPKNVVVALGDSYASGEGTGAADPSVYYHETDVNGTNWMRNACHRSRYAWSRRATLADSNTIIGDRADNWSDTNIDYHLLACSGARTEDLLSQQPGMAGELPQLQQGFLDAETTLVTLSVGGNDARFSDVVKACVTLFSGKYCGDQTLPGDTEPLWVAEPKRIQYDVMPKVVTTINKIHQLAPNAKIVLMGYPVLIEKNGGLTKCTAVFSYDSALWMENMATLLRDQFVSTVNGMRSGGIPVTFADPIDTFAGKGACGNPELINFIVTSRTPGEDTNPLFGISQQSMHPTGLGALYYASVLDTALRSIGM